MDMDYTFDLLNFEKSSNEEKNKIASKIDKHLCHTGFLIVTNHGIKENIINNISLILNSFFQKEQSFKNKSMSQTKGYPYGYFMSGSEALAKSKGVSTPPDLKESFNGGPFKLPKGKISKEAKDFCYLPTIWPEIKNFRVFWEDYYSEMECLSQRIMSVFAIALNLPSNYFEKFINYPISALRALNYPPIKKELLPNQQRAGAHTDYGSLTILRPIDKIDGLQIQDAKNRWIDVPNIKNSFIINIGDLMALWTNDRWTSTLHRVIPKDRKNPRKTLVFFHQPNWDARITCLSSCIGKGKKYSEVLSGPYLLKKFRSTI